MPRKDQPGAGGQATPNRAPGSAPESAPESASAASASGASAPETADPAPAGALASAEDLATSVRKAAKSGPPPVHLWNPPFCGDLDMRIARDGTWFYLGTPIGRPALVKLFASVLRRDGEDYFLVTPVEKVGITVDDAPFVAVDFRVEGEGRGQRLIFTTNVGDEAAAGPEHPLRMERDADTGEPSPYVHVRAALDALIDRKSFYRLVDLGVHERAEGADWFGVWSGGIFFPLLPSREMES